MNSVYIKDMIEMTDAELIQGSENIEFKNISIDTRTMQRGEIFVAIEEGNNYIEKAMQKGAKAIITEQSIDKTIIEKYPQITIVKVKSSVNSLQTLAKYKRNKYNIPVVAITGSVGKTSTKDIVANVVKQKYNVLKTEENFNNHIGVPLTILKLDNHDALVIEMGMNHKKEISVLTEIAKPTIAVITNIGTAHIGILGSRENILMAKLEILEGLQPNGKIIINNDNDLLNEWNKKYNKAITYGMINKSDYMATNVELNENGSKYNIDGNIIKVPISGTHFLYNSLCAYTVGKTLNIEEEKIIEGIEKTIITHKRMETKRINGYTIINDSYNASYESMKYALEYLNNISGKRKIAILGDMLELGEYSTELHNKVGKEVKGDILITVGTEARKIAETAKVKEEYSFNTNVEASNKIKEIMKKGDVILLKASKAMKFGEILNEIEKKIERD